MIGSPEFTQAAAKKEVRGLEKCALKLAKSGCRLLFNGACLRENVLPNYSSNHYYYIKQIHLGYGKINFLN